MCNQIFIFEKFTDNPQSNICKNKIMNFLMASTTKEIRPCDIVNIRLFYKHYLESCFDRNLITSDDFDTYNELYSIIDPFIVDYDTKYPEPLDVVGRKILDKYHD